MCTQIHLQACIHLCVRAGVRACTHLCTHCTSVAVYKCTLSTRSIPYTYITKSSQRVWYFVKYNFKLYITLSSPGLKTQHPGLIDAENRL